MESVDGGWVALVGEWLWSMGGATIGLCLSVGGATRFWERRYGLRGRKEIARNGDNR